MKKALVGGVLVALILIIVGSYLSDGSPQQSSASTTVKPAPAKAKEASRLNNLGAAYMNQQAFEKALKYFQEASAADPTLHQARLNQGIALLNLRKVAEASPILQEAIKRDPNDARAWYNLGLLHKSSGDSAQHSMHLSMPPNWIPMTPTPITFWGWCIRRLATTKCRCRISKSTGAISIPRFSRVRTCPRLSKARSADQAKTHLARFQHLTQAKLGTPITSPTESRDRCLWLSPLVPPRRRRLRQYQ